MPLLLMHAKDQQPRKYCMPLIYLTLSVSCWVFMHMSFLWNPNPENPGGNYVLHLVCYVCLFFILHLYCFWYIFDIIIFCYLIFNFIALFIYILDIYIFEYVYICNDIYIIECLFIPSILNIKFQLTHFVHSLNLFSLNCSYICHPILPTMFLDHDEKRYNTANESGYQRQESKTPPIFHHFNPLYI